MTISDHVRRLRALPSTTDDRRGRELRSAAGSLLWHSCMYHPLRSEHQSRVVGFVLGCRLCHSLAGRVKLAMMPSSARCLQLGAEDYSPITSADW